MNKDRRTDPDTLARIDEDASMANLSQVLAHRLRGLVAGIEGYTDLLADTLDSSEQRELAMKIMEGAARIESILADLQLYSEDRQPAMLPLRVDEVLRGLLAPLPEEDAERVTVASEDGHAAATLLADPFLLRQALLVLIQNALEARRNEGEVRVVTTRSHDYVAFHVRNDGVIDVESPEETLFTPFYTTKAQNLGVGLSMALRIARLHGGTLELTENSAEEGTCFTLAVPESPAGTNA